MQTAKPTPAQAQQEQRFAILGLFFLYIALASQPANGNKNETTFKPVFGWSSGFSPAEICGFLLSISTRTTVPHLGQCLALSEIIAPQCEQGLRDMVILHCRFNF